jgi:uncharacterized membrane protein YbjE (DUF340 family)
VSTRLDGRSTTPAGAAPIPARTVVLAAVLDVVAVLVFVAIGRRSHDETGSVVAGVAKVAAPFLIALTVGWIVSRAWRAPTTLSTVAVIWLVTVVLGMVLRHTVFDKGTATSFIIVTAVVTFVFLFGWRVIANKVFAADD